MSTRPGQLERLNNVRSVSSRPLSNTNPAQRPSPHRSLSQQFTSSSPTRRNTNEGVVDLSFDGLDGGGNRTIPRSRLNLEIGKDLGTGDLVESPKPSSATVATFKAAQPARGRPRLHSEFANVNISASLGGQESERNEAPTKPMPLPVRPGQHAHLHGAGKLRPAPSNANKKDMRPKPYTLEVPAVAPNFPPNGHADFYPWTGNHPEDQFSDTVIKQGYFDKAQMTQNETGSGKPSIFPALKHKSGLQTLSSLFTSILAQRRAYGQITSASTFKPPPRVTVTDTKREMWLKDLANPTIPLRRLSRSIPHGIRGKVLLDQSLSKNIPIDRAVWLAKCVGANELRAFRRKGVSGALVMGGEAKWIRDFTVCVEQFVEGIVATCGDKDFRTRINYAIRLATYFHSEYLLDREHYMDWVVSALENSNQAKLPIWLIITQIYWKDLLQHRKYGRRLSAALLNHLSEVSKTPDRDILAPLHDRIKQLLKNVLLSSPDSFVSPKVWSKYEELVNSTYLDDEQQFLSHLESLSQRNKYLQVAGLKSDLTPRRTLIKLLDAAISSPMTHDLPLQCWNLDDEKEMLALTILEWSTSLRRPGSEKVFVAVRILRYWAKLGFDVTNAILSFIESGVCDNKSNKNTFYHIVSELARSEHFSAARYLQWLIARGGIYAATDVAKDAPCATRLAVELPTHNLSEKIYDLRAALLGRAGYMVDEEEDHNRACMIAINRSLPGTTNDGDLDLADDGVAGDAGYLIANASRSTKSEIGLWLRQKVRQQIDYSVQPSSNDWDNPAKKATTSLSLSNFNAMKSYLVLAEDYSMLADVLKLIAGCNNADLLASCADSVNLQLMKFSAIGATRNLFDLLMAQTRAFTEELDSAPRVLLVSLSDLASRLSEQTAVARHLSQELARSDRKTAADACSPVSDHMALMQTAESDFSDEIEKILASGTSMDKSTLKRLFQRIILRLEESFDKSPEQQRSCVLLLTRLKTFDSESFNILMITWVSRFLQLVSRPSMIQILGPLLSFGCVALPDVVNILISGKTSIARNAQEALSLILAIRDVPEAISDGEACRLLIKQSHLQKDHPREVLYIIRQAMESAPEAVKDLQLLRSNEMHQLLQRLVLTDADLVVRELVSPLIQRGEPAVLAEINAAIDKLFLHHDLADPISAETILDLADDLSLPFCQVKLATMLTSSDSVMAGTDDNPPNQLEAFDKAIESALNAGRTSWASIIPLLDSSIARHLRHRAEAQLLTSVPSIKTFIANVATSINQNLSHAKNLLQIIQATSCSISKDILTSNSFNTVSDIPTALHSFWLLLSNSQIESNIKESLIRCWLPLLLAFANVYRDAFENSKAGNECRGKIIVAFAAIYLELENYSLKMEGVALLAEQIYDAALYLVDPLSDDVRLQCIKLLRDTTSVPRIRYLLSISPNPTEWLVLMHRDKIVPGPPAPNTSNAGAPNSDGKTLERDKGMPFPLRRWEMLGEPTPNIGENDTSLSLTLFGARKG